MIVILQILQTEVDQNWQQQKTTFFSPIKIKTLVLFMSQLHKSLTHQLSLINQALLRGRVAVVDLYISG